MILFKKVKFKNFLSTGDKWTEIDLNSDGTTIVVGTNGAGKSTILDALCFVLFNKPYRKITKSQLINTTNEKGTLVEIDFSIGNTEYNVTRGIKPNLFDIKIDGRMRNKEADDRINQKILEEQILKLNYKSFTQIVILGSSNFVPFMQLSAPNRREVIEDLLDIKIFSAMNLILKEKLRSNREIVRTLELKKETLKDKVSMQENFIDKMNTRSEDDIKEKELKLDTIALDVNQLLSKNESLSKDLDSVQTQLETVSDASKRLVKLGSLKQKISNKVSRITKEHKFFTDNTVCPTCSQNIEESFRLNRIDDAQNKAKELRDGYQKLEESITEEGIRERHFTKLSKEITELTNGISQNSVRVNGLQQQTGDLQQEIQILTDNLKNKNTEHEKLEKYKKDLESCFGNLAKQNDEITYNDHAYELLRDGGVKGKIIKKYLPLINQQVNRYLQMMDFYINFRLDEEFNETIENPIHDKFTYSSFSEGEKMRIDLALLFTWREVARFKNSTNTNLLIMDEVFDSSLDGLGTDEFIKIIKYVVKDANVFVISHKVDMLDRFQTMIEFTKKGGFSYATKSAVEQ
jgi:DNA repair exonuclease SbcCD ATPase subunit|tara:strand:+ start:3865 stop:5592 length:1728 start_codon:yes stop_codon:yes gene_type:complete